MFVLSLQISSSSRQPRGTREDLVEALVEALAEALSFLGLSLSLPCIFLLLRLTDTPECVCTFNADIHELVKTKEKSILINSLYHPSSDQGGLG